MLTTQDENEKATQIDKVLEMLMKHDTDANKKISQLELKAALADAGLLEACMGQNLNFEGATDVLYNTSVKSRACIVM